MFLGRRTLTELGYKEMTPLELEDGDIRFSEAALKDGLPFLAIGHSAKTAARASVRLPKVPPSVRYVWIEGKGTTLFRRSDGPSFSRCVTLPTITGVVWGQHGRDDLLPLHSVSSAVEYAQALLPVPNDEAVALLLGLKLLDEASGGELLFRLTEVERDQASALSAELARAFGLESEWDATPALPEEALEQILLAWQSHRFLSALSGEGVFSTLAALLASGNRGAFALPASIVRLIQSVLAGAQDPVAIAGYGAAPLLDVALSTGTDVSLIGTHHPLLTAVARALLPSCQLVPEGLLDLDDDVSWSTIVCQPPFGRRIIDSVLLDRSEMASAWRGRRAGAMSAEALWLEKCYGLLVEQGLLVAILPDGFLSNVSLQPARRWIMDRFELEAVLSLPDSIFRPATSVKCSVVCLRKAHPPRERYRVFMAELEEADLENSSGIAQAYRQAVRAEEAA